MLSHGHFDHTTGVDGLIRTLGKANVPVLIHPEFWSRRRLALPGREPLTLPTTSRSALEGAGFEIIEQQQPSFLLAGSLLVTGEVDRTSGFERGLAIHQACRDGEWQPDPLILDDQAPNRQRGRQGLVVLTACGHAGVVNTVRYARRLTGEDRVHAMVGGFHLNGPLFEPIIASTCDALAELDPDYLVPTHCTGWRAIHALAARFPNAYLQASVGTRFKFHSDERPAHMAQHQGCSRGSRSIRDPNVPHAAEQECVEADVGVGGLASRSARTARRRGRVRRAHSERRSRSPAGGAGPPSTGSPDRRPRVRRNRYGHEMRPAAGRRRFRHRGQAR